MDDTYIGGIDEAGRGPVLGPMVYSLAIIKKSHYVAFGKWWNNLTLNHISNFNDFLKENENLLNNDFDINSYKDKYKDSKMLNEQEREKLFNILSELRKNSQLLDFKTISISAKEISLNNYSDNKVNLNQWAKNATVDLIKVLSEKYKIETIFVDALGPSNKHQDFLSNQFNDINFRVTSKCDTLISITSATSVCAKYTRDYELKNYKFTEEEFSRDFGIGYPTDPKSISWLKKYLDPILGFPNFVRFSWSTAYKHIDNFKFYTEEEEKEKADFLKKRLEMKKSYFKKSNLSYDFDLYL